MAVTVAVPQMGNDLFRKYMKSKYVKSIECAGGNVKWIELDNAENAVKTALSCDGLLLPGGADIDPKLYNAERNEKCGKPNELRDSVEPLLLKAFTENGKPVLGICRGIQLINVFFGGTLFQDIEDDKHLKHMDFFSRSTHIHSVDIAENTALYGIIGQRRIDVNSLHHQAIDKVAEGFKLSAVASDGTAEAIEKEDYPFLIGVQWHPEHMSKKSEIQRKIFKAFIDRCAN